MDYLAVAHYYYRKGAYQPFLWRTLVAILFVSGFLFSPLRSLAHISEGAALLTSYVLVELYAILVGYLLQPNPVGTPDEVLYLSAASATPGRVVLGRYTGLFGLVLSLWLVQTVIHLLLDFALTRGINMGSLLTEHLRILPVAGFYMVSTALLSASVAPPFGMLIALVVYLASYLPAIPAVKKLLPAEYFVWYPGAQRLEWIYSATLANPTVYYAPYLFALVFIMIHFFRGRAEVV